MQNIEVQRNWQKISKIHTNPYFFLVLALAISGIVSHYSLIGSWEFTVLGDPLTWMWDPDSAYLASGLTFFDETKTAWVGHPGLPLMLTVKIVGWLAYGFSYLTEPTPVFAKFAAYHFGEIILLTRVTMTLLHWLSASIVYKLALKLMKDKRAALIAAVIYGTSFPVLFYANKISSEPLLVMSILLAFLYAIKAVDDLSALNIQNGYRNVMVASFFSIAAVFTKVTLAPPILVFIPIFLYFGKNSIGPIESIRAIRPKIQKTRVQAICIFLATSSLLFVLFGQKIDWKNFLEFWFSFAPGDPKFNRGVPWYDNIATGMPIFLRSFAQQLMLRFSNEFWLPVGKVQRWFTISEIPLAIFCIFGMALHWQKRGKPRSTVVWVVFFLLLFSPLAVYKAAFWYFFIHLAIMSIYSAIAVQWTVEKFRSVSKTNQLKAGIVLAISMHFFSIVCFIDLKRNDIEAYKNWQPMVKALSNLKYDEKIGLIGTPGPRELFGYPDNYCSANSEFIRNLYEIFYSIPPGTSREEISAKRISTILHKTGNKPISIVGRVEF